MKKFSLWLIALFACAIGLNIIASEGDNARKSKYYRLLGMQQEVDGNLPEAYSLYRHAWEADPTSKQAGYYYGRTALFVADSAQTAQCMALMKDFVDEYPGEVQDNLYYANICLQSKQYDEAMRIYKRTLGYEPDDTFILEMITKLHLANNEPDSAMAYIKRLTALDEGEEPYVPYIVSAYMAKEDTVGLYKYLDDKIAAKPSGPYYYVVRAILSPSDDKEQAEHYYALADSLFPGNFYVKHAKMTFYDAAGDSAALQQTMYEALMCEDADLEDKTDIFTAYVGGILETGKPDEHTDTMMMSLLEQYPYEARMRKLAAEYFMVKDDNDRALENIEIAVDMEPENTDYRTLYVQQLTSMERYADAIRVYEQAINYDHDRPLLEFVAAADYNFLDMPEKAMEVLDLLTGNLMTGIGFDKNTDPLSLSEKQLLSNLNSAGAQLLSDVLAEKGNILFKTKQYDDAVKHYDLALELNDSEMVKNNYAYFMAEAGLNLEKAAELSKATVESSPENPVYLDTYAYILFRLGEYPQALEYIKKALDCALEQGQTLTYDYYEHYGDILSMSGKTAEAVDMWRKALALDPDNKLITQKIKAKKYINE